MRSVLQQKCSDFEVVISDNFSSDNTKEVAENFDDERVFYFRTSESLPMNESYKFALRHARGEYITFLSDDDAFSIELLEKAQSVINRTKAELLCWRYAFYYLNDKNQNELPPLHPLRRIRKNTVAIQPFCSQLFEIDPRSTIKHALLDSSEENTNLLTPQANGPAITNTLYHRNVFERIEKRGLDLFPKNVIPDVYSGTIIGSQIEKYFFLDEPLTIYCVSENSTTSSSNTDKEKLAKQFQDLQNGDPVLFTPIKSLLNFNYRIQSILQAKHDVGRDLEDLQLNRSNYFIIYHQNLLFLKDQGIDIKSDLDEFNRVLVSDSEAVQNAVRAAIAINVKQTIRQIIKKMPRPPFLTKRVARSMPEKIHQKSIIIRGKDAGFENILEFATWLNSNRLEELSEFSTNLFHQKPAELPFGWQIN